MTHHLAALRLANIGDAAARFSDLTMDFTDGMRPVDSVVWLRNGGGKSTILSLFLSLLLPRAYDFMSHADNRDLIDYVQTGDTSHVIAEWHSANRNLLDEPEFVLVTGVVYEWPSRTRPERYSRAELNMSWYAYYTVPGVPSAAALPIDGRRGHYLDMLRGLQARNPGMDLVIADSQDQWARTLRSVGLDPELFLRQKQMNEREGGAAALFTVKSVEEFINLLLDLTVRPDRATEVSANVSAIADKVAKKPTYLVERRFCDQAIPVLRDLADATETEQKAEATAAEAAAAADRLAGALLTAEQNLETRAGQLRADAERVDAARRDADNAADRELSYVNAYKLQAARLDLADAQASAAGAEQQVTEAQNLSDAWAAALDLAELRARRAEHQMWQALREAADAESAPVRAEHDRAAAILVTRLGREAERARSAAVELTAKASAAAAAAEAAKAAARTARNRETAARVSAGQSGQTINEYKESLQAAVTAGVLPDVTSDPQTQLDAARRRDTELEAAIGDAALRFGEAASALNALAGEQHGIRYEIANTERDLSAAEGDRSKLAARRDTLADTPLLRRILQAPPGEPVDVWGEAETLTRGLTGHAANARRTQIDAAAANTEDARLVDGVDRTGYLPSTPDAERVIAALARRAVTAQPGWEYLRSAHHAAAAAAPPGSTLYRVGVGVVVAAEHAEQALNVLVSSADPTLALVGVYTNAAADAAAADPNRVDVIPLWEQLEPGVLSRSAADERARVAQEAHDRRVVESEQARREESAARDLLDQLDRFWADCPEGHLNVLAEQVRHLAEKLARLHAAAAEVDLRRTAATAERDTSAADRAAAETDRRALVKVTARLEGLAAATPKCTAAQAARTESEAEAAAAARDADTAERLAAEHSETAAAARAAAVESSRTANGYDRDISKVAFIDSQPDVGDTPIATVDEARAAYTALHDSWQQHIAADVTASNEANAEREARVAAGKVAQHPVTAVSRAEQLLATAEGQEDEARRGAAAAAQRQIRDAATRKGQAASHVTVCAGAVKARQAEYDAARRPVTLPAPPASRAECETLAAEHAAAHQQQLAATRAAAAEAEGIAASLTEVTATASAYHSHRGHLPNPNPETTAEKFTGDGDTAGQAVLAANQNLKDANRAVVEARERVSELLGAARRAASASTVQMHVRTRLLNDANDRVAASAAEWARQMETRIATIDAELESIEADQGIVAEVLAGLVREALRAVKSAERHSRIGGNAGTWAGKHFLQIRFTDPDDATLAATMTRVIDEHVARNSRPEGMPLLRAAVRAAVAPGGFRVTILKPAVEGDPIRADVTQLSKWSGGEALTVAIALYCTLAKVSAANRGIPGAEGGTLVLDNPIGKANSPTLLSLQHAIAAASGVQLIYATGVDDLGALAKFGTTVRLDNRAAANGNRRYVIHERESQPIRVARVARAVQ